MFKGFFRIKKIFKDVAAVFKDVAGFNVPWDSEKIIFTLIHRVGDLSSKQIVTNIAIIAINRTVWYSRACIWALKMDSKGQIQGSMDRLTDK